MSKNGRLTRVTNLMGGTTEEKLIGKTHILE